MRAHTVHFDAPCRTTGARPRPFFCTKRDGTSSAFHGCMPLSIRFWGVRGSCPTPGPETALVGGNTSCVEVVAGATRIALDAGHGAPPAGRAAARGAARAGGPDGAALARALGPHPGPPLLRAHLRARDAPRRRRAGRRGRRSRDTLRRQMSAPTFPVDWKDVPAVREYVELRDGVTTAPGRRRGAHRPREPPRRRLRLPRRARRELRRVRDGHRALRVRRSAAGHAGRDADVLIYDAQYLPEEYAGKVSRVGGALDVRGGGGARAGRGRAQARALPPRSGARRRPASAPSRRGRGRSSGTWSPRGRA